MAAIDRRAWEERTRHESGLLDRERRAEAALARLRQAAVPLERLTGSEHWDTFLRMAEALQERDRAALAAEQAALAEPAYLTPGAVALGRHALLVLTAAIKARQQLMDLPKSLLADLHTVK
jgi:hypothetical protein